MADITVEVTSPGTLTTWGQSSWGSSAWGQISGLSADQASADITIDSSVDLSTNLLNITTDSVSFIITGSVDLSTNLLNTTTGTAEGQNNIEVEVTSPGNLPWGTESWGYGS